MEFLVPNYSCLQNPWLGCYRPQIPVLSVLCPKLNLLKPPPLNKIPGYATVLYWGHSKSPVDGVPLLVLLLYTPAAHYGVRQLLKGDEEADPWNIFQKNSCHYISVVPCVKKPTRMHIVLSFMAQQPIVSQGLIVGASRSHSDNPHSVGLLWISDRPEAETSTWQHTTLTTDRHPYPRWDSNPQSQQEGGRRYTPYTARLLGSYVVTYWYPKITGGTGSASTRSTGDTQLR